MPPNQILLHLENDHQKCEQDQRFYEGQAEQHRSKYILGSPRIACNTLKGCCADSTLCQPATKGRDTHAKRSGNPQCGMPFSDSSSASLRKRRRGKGHGGSYCHEQHAPLLYTASFWVPPGCGFPTPSGRDYD